MANATWNFPSNSHMPMRFKHVLIFRAPLPISMRTRSTNSNDSEIRRLMGKMTMFGYEPTWKMLSANPFKLQMVQLTTALHALALTTWSVNKSKHVRTCNATNRTPFAKARDAFVPTGGMVRLATSSTAFA